MKSNFPECQFKHYNNKMKMIKRRNKRRIAQIITFQQTVEWCNMNALPNSDKRMKKSLLKELEKL